MSDSDNGEQEYGGMTIVPVRTQNSLRIIGDDVQFTMHDDALPGVIAALEEGFIPSELLVVDDVKEFTRGLRSKWLELPGDDDA